MPDVTIDQGTGDHTVYTWNAWIADHAQPYKKFGAILSDGRKFVKTVWEYCVAKPRATMNTAGTINAIWDTWTNDTTDNGCSSGTTAVYSSDADSIWVGWNEMRFLQLESLEPNASEEEKQLYNQFATWVVEENTRRQQEVVRQEELRVAEEQRRREEYERSEEYKQRQAQLAREQAERERKRKEAQERAHRLLLSLLSPKVVEDFEKNRCIDVDGKSGYKYKIYMGRSGNVDMFDKEGKLIHELCFHPNISCPNEDTVLVQYLMLKNDEEEVLRIANKHSIRNLLDRSRRN